MPAQQTYDWTMWYRTLPSQDAPLGRWKHGWSGEQLTLEELARVHRQESPRDETLILPPGEKPISLRAHRASRHITKEE